VSEERLAAARDLLAPLGVALVVLALCRATLLPGVAFWDTAEFQVVGPVLGTAHPTGFPAYVILGWLASVVLQPFGDPAFRMNLLSALLVATAAGLTVALVRRLTASTLLGVAAGLGLGLNPIAWRIGTRADAHAFHLALVALLLVALVAWQRERGRAGGDRWLVAASAIFGVAVANHSLTLLLAPAVGLYVLAVDPRMWRRVRFVALCAGVLFGTAALLYLELPLRAGIFRAPLVYGTPNTWDGFWYIVLAEQFQGSIVDPFGELPRKLADLVDLTVTQFGPLAALLPVAFLATLVREPRYALLTGLAALVTVFFSMSYVNADIERYYLGPILIAWTWLAILAGTVAEQVAASFGGADEAARVGDAPGAAASSVAAREADETDDRPWPAPRSVREAALAGALAIALIVPTLAELDARAREVDASDDRGAAAWLDSTLSRLEPDAVVVSWWSYSTALWYAQLIEGRIPEVTIVDDRTRLDQELGEVEDVIEDYLGRRPVYLIRADGSEIERVAGRYRLDPGPTTNALVRVVERLEASR
jgi:hypothetical protein